MKFRISYEGDSIEDEDEIKQLAHINDLFLANLRAKEKIRSLLKYDESIFEDSYQIRYLEEIQDLLYVEGLE